MGLPAGLAAGAAARPPGKGSLNGQTDRQPWSPQDSLMALDDLSFLASDLKRGAKLVVGR